MGSNAAFWTLVTTLLKIYISCPLFFFSVVFCRLKKVTSSQTLPRIRRDFH
jgi:hypothetical protein